MLKVFTPLSTLVRNLRTIVSDGLRFFVGVWRGRATLAAENLFLRKQLALFREREKKAMRTTPADSVPGDLWICGAHRVLCGDATEATAVDRLLGTAIPALMI